MNYEEFPITEDDVRLAYESLPYGKEFLLIENLEVDQVGHATADLVDLSLPTYTFQRAHFSEVEVERGSVVQLEIIPGYIIAEALGQLTGALAQLEMPETDSRKLGVLKSGQVDLYYPSLSHERLRLEVIIKRNRMGFIYSDGYAFKQNGRLAGYAQTIAGTVNPQDFLYPHNLLQ